MLSETANKRSHGFTLLELLITVTILSIVIAGLQQVIASGMSAYETVKSKQELQNQAQFAVERMVMFVQESDEISSPDTASNQETLQISERVMDTYNNSSRAYDVDGDGTLDADNDNDGVVNENTTTPDPPDYIIFDLDKTDADNWKLQEKMPDYSTANLTDYRTTRVLCENVATFSNNLVRKNDLEFFPDLVEIQLTLSDGINEVSFKTRARARMID